MFTDLRLRRSPERRLGQKKQFGLLYMCLHFGLVFYGTSYVGKLGVYTIIRITNSETNEIAISYSPMDPLSWALPV